ncbi:unnamed protein product [Cylicostephanus goldi]|uniref:SCP domain-containing protein n=1 Tax=Cylicostephanus goldi TaxID=71465 RepID=A0A3P6T5K9_CYLGO|nr:unnamed protein product [Cylicostephanus goldi]
MFLLLVLPLTAVVPSASPEALCADNGGKIGESSINDILKVINNKRKKLAKEGITAGDLPEAVSMNKLAWDCELEKDAIAALGSDCLPKTDPAPADSTKNTGLYFK